MLTGGERDSSSKFKVIVQCHSSWVGREVADAQHSFFFSSMTWRICFCSVLEKQDQTLLFKADVNFATENQNTIYQDHNIYI